MSKLKWILEAAYNGNQGFAEMVKLFQQGTPAEIKELEKIIAKEDWVAYKKIVKRILGVKLK